MRSIRAQRAGGSGTVRGLLGTVLLVALWTAPRAPGQDAPYVGCDITKCDPTWMPALGNTTTFTARIYRKFNGDCPLSAIPGIIHFTLESSSERGYCLNKGTHTHTDLHFHTPENAGFVVVENSLDECDLVGGPHDHWMHLRTAGCVTE